MEPLWSPVVATGGNRSQITSTRKRLKQAKTVAAGCGRLPQAAHGKEGVDGSSPSEGLQKNSANEHVSRLATLAEEPAQYWSARAALPWN